MSFRSFTPALKSRPSRPPPSSHYSHANERSLSAQHDDEESEIHGPDDTSRSHQRKNIHPPRGVASSPVFRNPFLTQPASTSTRSGTQPHHRVNTKPIPDELIDPHLLEQSSARNIGATIKKLVTEVSGLQTTVSRLTSEVRELVKMNGQLEQEWSEKHEALLEEVAELRGEILKIKSTSDSGPKQPAKTGRLTELDKAIRSCFDHAQGVKNGDYHPAEDDGALFIQELTSDGQIVHWVRPNWGVSFQANEEWVPHVLKVLKKYGPKYCGLTQEEILKVPRNKIVKKLHNRFNNIKKKIRNRALPEHVRDELKRRARHRSRVLTKAQNRRLVRHAFPPLVGPEYDWLFTGPHQSSDDSEYYDDEKEILDQGAVMPLIRRQAGYLIPEIVIWKQELDGKYEEYIAQILQTLNLLDAPIKFSALRKENGPDTRIPRAFVDPDYLKRHPEMDRPWIIRESLEEEGNHHTLGFRHIPDVGLPPQDLDEDPSEDDAAVDGSTIPKSPPRKKVKTKKSSSVLPRPRPNLRRNVAASSKRKGKQVGMSSPIPYSASEDSEEEQAVEEPDGNETESTDGRFRWNRQVWRAGIPGGEVKYLDIRMAFLRFSQDIFRRQ
ncbi:uncharacterized protein EI90DRAFT_3243699 [Cantharellus anzutake]|uniref:uncharacterized protein n=1 Tax=Cantharellus anzutake TaxID=1750568 RepID=UPI001904070B|nr:uncharacterized protein EI90DRAFT_3243699 [Cantharellus anzutake]KAF8324604.1 hypothetical protein EI90DRAFT_3243699 [Cantharellus anzutake]